MPITKKQALILGSALAATVVAGYATWGALSAVRQNDTWRSAVHGLGESTETYQIEVTGDLSAVTIASVGDRTCTKAEIVADYVIAAAGYEWMVDAGILTPIAAVAAAERDAANRCAAKKEAQFNRSVAASLKHLTGFLERIDAPQRVPAVFDGLRGLDGAQSENFTSSSVGAVMVHGRYDGSNGLRVTVSRDQSTFVWVPFG